MPMGDQYVNFADCVRQNSDKNNPDAYCGSIKARTENKSLRKAVSAASHLNQAVRLALSAIAKRDPVKEEGNKKLKEADGVAADGAQDDQAFAVAFGPDNYDQLMKRIMAAPYREAYQAAGTIIKAIERKQMNMNFPGDLETHLKKAHAAVHGREMWDERYSEICDLLKKARKLLHDIEREAEAADQEQQGQEIKQVVGKADPTDSKPRGPGGPGYGPSRHPQSGKGMGVPGGVAKPGWAQTKQPIPGGGSKIASHKDKQGKTTHHWHTSASGRPESHKHPAQDPAHQHRSPRPGITQPRSTRGQKFTPAYGYAGKALKAVRMASKAAAGR